MLFDDYQRLAAQTDQFADVEARGGDRSPSKGDLVPLFGLTGEVGTLLSEYKKLLRDGPSHLEFEQSVEEELGDILWYVATVASRYGLSLGRIARKNLKKVRRRWAKLTWPPDALDEHFPASQRLPRRFRYRLMPRRFKAGIKVVMLDSEGNRVGDPLTDNAHQPDGYRYHDAMHLAFAALLGWSPVFRRLLKRKRKKDPVVDEVEDGGRAAVIEEAIVAMAFEYAERHRNRLEGLATVDTSMLRSIQRLTSGLEVRVRSAREWEAAILKGFEVWRQLEANDGGIVRGNFRQRVFTYLGPK